MICLEYRPFGSHADRFSVRLDGEIGESDRDGLQRRKWVPFPSRGTEDGDEETDA